MAKKQQEPPVWKPPEVNGQQASNPQDRIDANVSDKELVARCCDLIHAMGSIMVAFVVANPEDGNALVDQIHQINGMAEHLAKTARR